MNPWPLLAAACAYGIATTFAIAWFANRADTARLDAMAADVAARNYGLDAEVVRLQDAETRLEAENRTLRETPPPTSQWWIGAGLGLVAGIVLGAWAL